MRCSVRMRKPAFMRCWPTAVPRAAAFIYDGEFSGATHAAAGVTATLLQQHGIRVFAESRIAELAVAIALEADE